MASKNNSDVLYGGAMDDLFALTPDDGLLGTIYTMQGPDEPVQQAQTKPKMQPQSQMQAQPTAQAQPRTRTPQEAYRYMLPLMSEQVSFDYHRPEDWVALAENAENYRAQFEPGGMFYRGEEQPQQAQAQPQRQQVRGNDLTSYMDEQMGALGGK